jgi:hypothetical protein
VVAVLLGRADRQQHARPARERLLHLRPRHLRGPPRPLRHIGKIESIENFVIRAYPVRSLDASQAPIKLYAG